MVLRKVPSVRCSVEYLPSYRNIIDTLFSAATTHIRSCIVSVLVSTRRHTGTSSTHSWCSDAIILGAVSLSILTGSRHPGVTHRPTATCRHRSGRRGASCGCAAAPSPPDRGRTNRVRGG
eukprot:9295838-Pyramimonas_sp.AAC.1